LKIANEKDSAFMSFALREATALKLSVRIQDVFTNFDDCSCALACQKQRSPAWCGIFGCLFLCFFLAPVPMKSGGKQKKERKNIYFFIEQSLNYFTFFALKQRK